jgi:hypothetical protein
MSVAPQCLQKCWPGSAFVPQFAQKTGSASWAGAAVGAAGGTAGAVPGAGGWSSTAVLVVAVAAVAGPGGGW